MKAAISGGNHSRNCKINRMKIYNENPKLCKNCNDIIKYEKRYNMFCSHSCAASYNNLGSIKNKLGVNGNKLSNIKSKNKGNYNCLFCGKLSIYSKGQKLSLCSDKCRKLYNTKYKIENNNFTIKSSTIRSYLIETRGYKCEECGLSLWSDLPIPLDMHHIDGNANNNKEENLKLICKNCHGLTDSYGAKNIGKSTRKPYWRKQACQLKNL